ncbi:MAG: type I methionyl aminopeptidase [Patescibacteria group bacterium]|nr:type I methionyl aminopeptidase [Patescibacteria group bacterium]MDE1988581.1 type I methionyl aminopeptidase [Patescibacteria group bacterium]MDE2218088.1 type I methionyl aminopeptidase [Patescibacteria group bacterium]
MITIKTKEEIEILREGGRRLAKIMEVISEKVAAGVNSIELNDLAEKMAVDGGDKPAFLNYRPYGAKRPYPASLCVSVNDEIVHGIPNEGGKILKEGDIVSLDMGLIHKGLMTDMAVTVPVGKVDDSARKLIEVCKESLMKGIEAANGGNTIGDIGFAIERFVRSFGYGIVRELAGHGVGHKVHEDPYVPNFGKRGAGEKLKPGMILAIEPMLNEGTEKITLDKDGYTYRTKDGKRSAHFEHTILITKGKAEILTKL